MESPDTKTGSNSRRTLFLIVAAVLLLSIAWTYLMGNAVVASNQAVVRQQAVIGHLNEVLSTVKDAETGQRGYLLTGEDRYLEPYHSAQSHIQEELASLNVLAQSEELLSPDVGQLKSLITRKLNELNQSLQLRRTQGFAAALALVRTNAGQQTMEQLRGLTSRMILQETAELGDQRKQVGQVNTERTVVFAICTLLNLMLLGWASWRIDREVAGRERSAEEVRRQKELLAVTLGSIGDGVIVTDPQARITFMNDVV